ncbi:superantigen-like protein, partial [Staphylococcus aureus]|nr:superantigen-like protein [Staphylococcus aureus]
EISLKELDFKLRKKLMNENGLYTTKRGSGAIVVKMVDGGFYTFELNKKLQEHRMGDVIDGTKIKEINVELN